MFANFGTTSRKEKCGLLGYRNEFSSGRTTIPTPLLSVSAFASVVHAVAQVEITQVYVNQENDPIETFYYFPLDSNGAVTHFHAEIEGRKIKGVVKAHEEAKLDYETAVSQGQTAFLGKQNKPDIFKIRIGFLKPGVQAKIVIGYVTEVKNEKGSSSIRFFLPTTVAPRYSPLSDIKGREESGNMTFSDTSPAQMSIQVNVVLQGDIKSIESPSHSILIAEKGPVPGKTSWSRSIVQLKGTTTDMDRDFVLLITPEQNQKPKMYMENIEKEGKKSMAAMVYLIPSFKLDDQKTELIFLLDQSGSMGGNSINLAKQALILFLHSLPVDCYFNVIGFGSHFSSLFPNSVRYDESNLSHALFHARGLNANMGGTEIFAPLRHIYNLPNIPGYLRQIFVLTDGEVSNTEQVIGLTKIYSHRIRLFSLGIGNSASHHLVEGLASSGGGTSVFVTNNEPFESKVLQQLKNAVEPSLTDITVEWDGLPTLSKKAEVPDTPPVEVVAEKTLFGYRKPVEGNSAPSPQMKEDDEEPIKQAPQKPPPIFDGSQMVLLGIFEGEQYPTGVTITADSPDGPLSIKIPLSDENDVGPTGMLHNLAAVKIVREMEMEITASEILELDYFPREKRMTTESIKAKIIKLACRHGIASRFTSFVAIDKQNPDESSEHWVMHTRNVPSQIPRGYSSFRQNYCLKSNSFNNSPNPVFSFGTSAGPTFGGSVFGSALHSRQSVIRPQQQSAGPVLFGAQSHSIVGGFGAHPQSSGLFGAQQQQLQSSGLFGAQQQQLQSSGLFRAQQQQLQSSGLFGAQQQQLQSSGLFGAQQQQLQSSGLFGAQQPQSTGTFIFSKSLEGSLKPSSLTSFSQTSAVSGFGSQPQPTTGIFGLQAQSATTFSFGSQQPQSFSTFGGAQPTQQSFSFSNCGSNVLENDPLHLPKESTEDPLHKIISVQSFMGFFLLNETLASVVGKDLAVLKQEAANNDWDEVGWATAISIVFLSQKLSERAEAWELIYKKARKWLETHHGNNLDSMLAAASKIIM